MIPTAPAPITDLSDDQRRAVERTGQDVCVVAGPGSGKTRVLTERFAWLVERQNVEPSRVVAITFTEKAATEIKRRLIDRFSATPERRESIERAWVATIDGFCARILQERALEARVPLGFSVLDQGASDRMLRRAADEALDELFREQPAEIRRLMEALDLSTSDDGRQPDLAASLIEIYETMRPAGMSEIPAHQPAPIALEQARELANEILRDPTPANTPKQRETIAAARAWASEFRALPSAPITLSHFNLVDQFRRVNRNSLVRNSLTDNAAQRLKSELLPLVQGQFLSGFYADMHYLLREAVQHIATSYENAKRAEAALDFADLVSGTVRLLEDPKIRNEVASRFDHVLMDELQDTNRLQWRLVHLLNKPFFGVGDINQSIYGFRGAEPAVFEEYRAGLVAAGDSVDQLTENHRSREEILRSVSNAFTGVTGVEPRELIPRRVFTEPGGPVVERMVGRGDRASEVEAAMIAARIRQFTDSGEYQRRDIAVLVRKLAATEVLGAAFTRFDIPYLVTGGRTFLEARETLDLMGLLAALVNPLDEIALIGVLRGPLVRMSDEEIHAMGREEWQKQFEQRFGHSRRMAGVIAPDLLIARILDRSGFMLNLSERARSNVDKFLDWLRREHRRKPRPLAELLEDLEALRHTESESEAPPPEAADAVRIMTIHQAKGLEFPVVFVSALDGGPDNRRPVIAFSAERGLGAKWRNPVTLRGESDAIRSQVAQETKTREEAEANRLLYVAMTRAEERLILSYGEPKRPTAWMTLAEKAVTEFIAADAPPVPPTPRVQGTTEPRGALISPPEVRGQYDSSVSATSVALFQSCPRKYYLSRYLGLEPPANEPGTGAMELGLAVHKSLAGGQVDSDQAAALADRFRNSALGLRAARAQRVEREFDFAIEIDDVIVTGRIDLWFEDPDGLVVVDYKTDRDEASAESYALQLRLYALALERYTGRVPTQAVLYYLRTDRQVEISLSEPDLNSARDSISAMREAQDSLIFPLNPAPQCQKCPFYRGACPAP